MTLSWDFEETVCENISIVPDVDTSENYTFVPKEILQSNAFRPGLAQVIDKDMLAHASCMTANFLL